MNSTTFINQLTKIIEQENVPECDVGFDRINDKDYITIIINGKYRRYTMDWKRVI